MNLPRKSTIAQETKNANKYILTDDAGTTQIVFFPDAPGPISTDPAKRGAQLDYTGVEGSFTFVGQQIATQDSPIGSLITVALEKNIDAGAVTFTLALPPVNLAGKKKQVFDTVGIKTKSFGNLPREGAKLIDTALCLGGVAENVILPF
jgi:hypothetical protein